MSPERDAKIQERVKAQFGRRAEAYAQSRPHALGDSLDLMVAWGETKPSHLVLDVATGAGFTAFAFANRARRVVATDITAAMLHQARRLASERGLQNVAFQFAQAEALPYRDGSFDIVTCRIAPHHFMSVPRFLEEARRVLKGGGALIVADSSSPEDPEIVRWQQEVERLRDPSHGKNYSPSEWKQMVKEAGFALERFTTEHRTRLVFSDWVRTSGSPPEVVEELREWFRRAPETVREAFQIRFEGEEIRFSWMLTIFLARKV